jgi:predicted TIM-barrel fold metal-dependent hydrolase
VIFDVHTHYGFANDDQFENLLLNTCRKNDIGRVCVMAIGRKRDMLPEDEPDPKRESFKWGVNNEEVISLAAKHKDIVVPVAYFRLDYDNPSLVDDLGFKGFKGIKFLWPRYNYDDERYFLVYEKAAANGMIVYFHTGPINGAPRERTIRTTMSRMKVENLEAIGRTFSDLRILACHFGYPDYEIACALARILPNLYIDISTGGPPAAPPVIRDDIFKRQLIGNLVPIEKLVFGSDCILEKVPEQIKLWNDLFEKLSLSESERELIFYKNAAGLFK